MSFSIPTTNDLQDEALAVAEGAAKAAFGTQVAGKSRANAKPHRRQAGHKPKSREQVTFARRAAELLASSANRGGRGTGGTHPAGPSGRAEKEKEKGKENDLVALIANDAAARLAAAESARAAPRLAQLLLLF